MKVTNQNPKPGQTQANTNKTKTNPQSINHELHTPLDEKPANVLQSWQNLRQLDNKLASQQNDDLPVD